MDALVTESDAPIAASIMDEVRGLRALIEARAVENENASELHRDVVEAVEASNLLRLMAPRAVGGLEVTPALLIDVLRELGYYDGSVGWYYGAGMTAGAVAGAYFGDYAIEAIFRGTGIARAAAQVAPTGKAERVAGGYRISGAFSFGSGSPSAEWLGGGYVLHEDGQPVMGAHGQPRLLIAWVPRAGVEFLGNWQVLGLRGTGSYDFRVPEQVIHQDFGFFLDELQQKRGGPLYRMGFMAIPCLTHAAFALGCGRRALDEWGVFARTKKRAPRGFANEMQTMQRDFGYAHGQMRAADAYVRNTYNALYDTVVRDEPIPEDLKVDGRLCASHATHVAAQVAQTAFGAATTTAVRNGNVLQRAYRDMQAGVSHYMTGELSVMEMGAVLAGSPNAALVF